MLIIIVKKCADLVVGLYRDQCEERSVGPLDVFSDMMAKLSKERNFAIRLIRCKLKKIYYMKDVDILLEDM